MGINGGRGIVGSGSVLGGSGISLAGGGGNDPDAQAAIDAIGADATIGGYLNQLFLDFKGEGSTTNNTNFYSKIYAAYPMSPSDASTISAATCKWNIIDPRNLDAAFRLTFVNSPVFSVINGMEQNGSGNGYANSHFVESANMTAGNNGMTADVKNAPIFPNDYIMGVQTIFSIRKIGPYLVYSASQLINTGFGPNNTISFSRRSATDFEAYYNGSSVGTNTTNSSTQSAADVFIGAVNGGAGSPIDFHEGDITFAVLHDGLTDNESQDLYDAINTWNTNLGR